MSDTSNPNNPTKQTFTASMSESDKYELLEQFRIYVSKHGDNKYGGCPFLSTNNGIRIGNDDSTLKAGIRGPSLLSDDFHFREKITHFDHERIPERVVHARGSGAHGYFQVYDSSMKEFTTADVLINPSLKTPTFVRFSTVLGSRGSADTVRDVRGFATRFYTNQGNWDIVGNNIPVFFIQDALKFPDLIHAGKPEPHNEIPQGQTAHDNFWDFISLMPEATHMICWALSDRAIPRSLRHMQGFGVNTFILVNESRQRTFVKFHWKPVLGVHSLTWDECLKINGNDPDFHRRDLYESIDNGAFPEYELGVQLVPESQEDSFDFDLLDCTKLIPEELIPVKIIGKMVLNRNPSEFFTEVEQVAFCTQNVIPGIDFSDDPMLQGRNFSYFDTQLTRLGGPNFQEIPINRPIVPVINNERDGFMKTNIHPGRINYWPNRTSIPKPGNAAINIEGEYKSDELLTHEPGHNIPEEQKEIAALRVKGFVHYKEKIDGMKVRLRGPKFQEHYNQATLFYNSLSAPEQLHLVNAAIFELGHVDDVGIRSRMIDRFNCIDHQLAVIVAQGVGISAPTKAIRKNHGQSSRALSQLNTAMNSIKGRKVAILAADGYDATQLAGIAICIKSLGAMPIVVSTRKGTIYSSTYQKTSQQQEEKKSSHREESRTDYSSVDAPFSIFTSRSVLFDSTIVLDGQQSITTLSQFGEATGWIAETFKHFKAILAIGAGIQLLKSAHLDTLSSIKIASEKEAENPVLSQGVITVYTWTSSPIPEQKASAGITGAVTSGLTGALHAVGHALGATTSTVGTSGQSPYYPGKAASLFIDTMMKHREWNRDVSKIPA